MSLVHPFVILLCVYPFMTIVICKIFNAKIQSKMGVQTIGHGVWTEAFNYSACLFSVTFPIFQVKCLQNTLL